MRWFIATALLLVASMALGQTYTPNGTLTPTPTSTPHYCLGDADCGAGYVCRTPTP